MAPPTPAANPAPIPVPVVVDPKDLPIFQAAAALIDADTNIDGSVLEITLRTIDPAKKNNFLRWYCQQMDTKQRARKAMELKAPALSVTNFVAELKKVDFSNLDSIGTFNTKINVVGYEPPPAPIILGSEKGLVFWLQLGNSPLDVKEDPQEKGDQHPFFVHFMDKNKAVSSFLRLGMYLGPIMSGVATGYNGEITDNMIDNASETGLQVFVNPRDKSIWAIVAKGGYDFTDKVAFDELKFDGWKAAGLTSDRRVAFDMICLYKASVVAASTGNPNERGIGGQRSLFEADVLDTLQVKKLEPYNVAIVSVAKMLAATTPIGGSGGAPAPAAA